MSIHCDVIIVVLPLYHFVCHLLFFILSQANCNDQDGGVLYGRWDGDYPDGTHAPTSWTGSQAILEEFWKNKNVVKYAQCWVFSGLVTTCM